MLPVEVEELAVVAEKFTAPVNVAPERAAYCERVAPLSAMILPVVPENTAIPLLAALPAFVTRLLTADVVAEPIREPDKWASLNREPVVPRSQIAEFGRMLMMPPLPIRQLLSVAFEADVPMVIASSAEALAS